MAVPMAPPGWACSIGVGQGTNVTEVLILAPAASASDLIEKLAGDNPGCAGGFRSKGLYLLEESAGQSGQLLMTWFSLRQC